MGSPPPPPPSAVTPLVPGEANLKAAETDSELRKTKTAQVAITTKRRKAKRGSVRLRRRRNHL